MNKSFLLRNSKIEFDQNRAHSIDFLGPNADLASTHISIIAGANGTSKSRLLATVIEQLSFARDLRIDPKLTESKYPTSHGLRCLSFSTIDNEVSFESDDQGRADTKAWYKDATSTRAPQVIEMWSGFPSPAPNASRPARAFFLARRPHHRGHATVAKRDKCPLAGPLVPRTERA